ncbi:seed biotin-containing protein SBP65-like isoform X1 [Zingiber officinale]|uniref:seed biotin-containing protein SBP65-like isoform X1 n=2 Tax=Zingiber officinale TaxID=94328 RepID=UPI001C4CA9EB|nr:seed biotin-containing protein SBP65-like isoform X1 [Zingiber officinale]
MTRKFNPVGLAHQSSTFTTLCSQSTMASQQEGERESASRGVEHGKEGMSPEDMRQYRVIAQQNSIESLSAAEKRYAKAKNAGAAEIHNTKEAVTHGLDAAGAFAVAKGAEATQGVHVVAEKGIEAKDYAAEKTRVAAEAAAQEMAKREKAEEVKEAAKSMAQKAMEKAQEAREAARETGEVAMKRAREKAEEAIEVAKRALEYAGTKGEGSLKDKDKATLKQAKEYAGQKAILVQEKVGEEQKEGRGEHGEPKQAEDPL